MIFAIPTEVIDGNDVTAVYKAAKTAVQLIFPLVLFIFPAIFVVLVGPAAIQIQKNLLDKGPGGGGSQ